MKLELDSEHYVKLLELTKEFSSIYGDNQTDWTLFDVNKMVDIGKSIVSILEECLGSGN
ncbi:MAG: hypothetical protein GX121_02290 [Ignavibacteria bacterium]|jgi:hypothetical protein|nr:hypothetical protein [Ignavibacteria bacterium]